MNLILIQTAYYAVVLLLGLAMVGFLQRGFFWKFMRVKLSFGKLIMCKLRAVNRDHYAVGRIDEAFLVFKKRRKEEKRISITDKSVFYRSLGVTWVDVDEEKSGLVKPDFSTVGGFDAVKYNNLYLRALYKPQIVENKEKIIIGGIILIIVLCAVLAFFLYKQGYNMEMITQQITNINKGLVVGTSPI